MFNWFWGNDSDLPEAEPIKRGPENVEDEKTLDKYVRGLVNADESRENN